jgi:hypothetical protein
MSTVLQEHPYKLWLYSYLNFLQPWGSPKFTTFSSYFGSKLLHFYDLYIDLWIIFNTNQQNAHIFIYDLVKLYCLRLDSNNQEFMFKKTFTCSLIDVRMPWRRPDQLYGCMKYTVTLHEQVFLRINTWLFETCQRQYNRNNP